MMILDEIQPGFGRTETFGFQITVVPDIVVVGRAWVADMRWCFTASSAQMDFVEQSKVRTHNYLWRTSCHSGSLLSYLQEITETNIMEKPLKKKLFRSLWYIL
jgi:4-aminobutyrate aminotransferase-like enzyme